MAKLNAIAQNTKARAPNAAFFCLRCIAVSSMERPTGLRLDLGLPAGRDYIDYEMAEASPRGDPLAASVPGLIAAEWHGSASAKVLKGTPRHRRRGFNEGPAMTAIEASPYFVSTEWLAAHLGDADVAVIDGTFFMPDDPRNAEADHLAAHIPGAVFFDIDAIADHTTDLPHMLPGPDEFCAAMGKLGLTDTMRIVVYDASGLLGAPRVWWTLKIFGANNVKILEGGLPKWRAEGRPLEAGPISRAPAAFAAKFDSAAVANAEKVRLASETGSAAIVDARAAARFRGETAEPRPGVRSGHIPASRNVPWREVIDEDKIKAPDEVKAVFGAAGVDLSRPIITTCGSGVTAAILLLALATAGKDNVALYDGSWSEWGARTDLPIASGPA